MNATFLLGNGFDLQLGMETGYRSFLRWYTEQPTEDMDIAMFRNYLKNEKSDWWSDAEVAMGQYLKEFSDKNIQIYFKNIRDFKLRLSEYLIVQNRRYDLEKMPSTIEAFRDFLLNSANDVMLRPDNLNFHYHCSRNDMSIRFLTFNYTDALDRILDRIREDGSILESRSNNGRIFSTRIGDVCHIHGTLDSSLIMGVDNQSQLACENITEFSKLNRTVIKPVVNEELGRDEHRTAQYLIKDCTYLFFYGLSFGETDGTWWNLVREKLIGDGSCQAVIFTRSSDDDIMTIIPEDVLDYVNDKKDEFLSKIGIKPGDTYYDAVRKKVFVIRNTKRLAISIKDREAIPSV